MGGGSYSFTNRSTTAKARNYASVTKVNLHTAFEQQTKMTIHEIYDPKGVVIRESRDSDEHPLSYPILLAIDVTGSMGSVPAKLVKDGLPSMIQRIFERNIPDPQVAFIGIGDHECDRHPLQIGQFESSDQKLDDSLTKMYIEGGGGGNSGESYLLAYYHAAMHTEIDSFSKRGQKGLLITIGDEPPLQKLPKEIIKNLYGLGQAQDYTIQELFKLASEKYDIYHINVGSTHSGLRSRNKEIWVGIIGEDRYVYAQSHEQIPEIIGDLANNCYNQERVRVDIDLPTKQTETDSDIIDETEML